ncbi:MAG: alpha-amylase family protein [Treponemataceae bacterium]
MQDNWFWDYYRAIHIDYHMPEFPKNVLANFDAKTFIEEIEGAHVNLIAVFTKCHFGNSFYPTKVGHRHSALKGDFFGEVLDEAKKKKIRVLAYYSLGTDEWAVKQNPDWYQIDRDGKERNGNGTVWHMPCLNSPYREELALPQIREIAQMYEPDGFFMDIPYIVHHHCFCRYCKSKFKNEHNRELTPELLDAEPDLVKTFFQESAARCHEEIRAVVKAIRPEAVIITNGAWKMGEPERFNRTADVGVWESQPAAGSYLYNIIKSRYVGGLDVPVQVQTVRFTEGWGLMSSKTAEQLKYESASIMANGSMLSIGDQVMPDGTLQHGAYEILKEVFAFVKEREPWTARSRIVPHGALIANYTTWRYWDNGDYATLGAAKMLIEGHQQFNIFFNDDFPDLAAFKLIVLPETVKLSSASLDRLRSWVAAGGFLVAAGRAAFPEGDSNFPLADLYGLDYLEYSPYRFAYLMQNPNLWKGIADIPQLLDKPFIKAVPRSGQAGSAVEILSRIQWPCGESVPPRAFRHPLPPPGDESVFPGVSLNRYGKGLCAWIAADVFSSYWNTGHFWLKNIVNNLIDRYDESKPFVFEGFPAVEAHLMTRGGKEYLHLVNFQCSHTGNRSTSLYDPIEQINPIHNLKIRIRLPGIREATQRPENRKLDIRRISVGEIEVTVPEVHIHSIIEITRNEGSL